ncbi:hypothetical protein V1514DRAFT_326569 [Lipomyces japonicus]|uniref:uncharacterized protein n=1 Tax=Lipomyces japonicus TaxID=56871 RepID=UPI0034CFC9D0
MAHNMNVNPGNNYHYQASGLHEEALQAGHFVSKQPHEQFGYFTPLKRDQTKLELASPSTVIGQRNYPNGPPLSYNHSSISPRHQSQLPSSYFSNYTPDSLYSHVWPNHCNTPATSAHFEPQNMFRRSTMSPRGSILEDSNQARDEASRNFAKYPVQHVLPRMGLSNPEMKYVEQLPPIASLHSSTSLDLYSSSDLQDFSLRRQKIPSLSQAGLSIFPSQSMQSSTTTASHSSYNSPDVTSRRYSGDMNLFNKLSSIDRRHTFTAGGDTLEQYHKRQQQYHQYHQSEIRKQFSSFSLKSNSVSLPPISHSLPTSRSFVDQARAKSSSQASTFGSPTYNPYYNNSSSHQQFSHLKSPSDSLSKKQTSGETGQPETYNNQPLLSSSNQSQSIQKENSNSDTMLHKPRLANSKRRIRSGRVVYEGIHILSNEEASINIGEKVGNSEEGSNSSVSSVDLTSGVQVAESSNAETELITIDERQDCAPSLHLDNEGLQSSNAILESCEKEDLITSSDDQSRSIVVIEDQRSMSSEMMASVPQEKKISPVRPAEKKSQKIDMIGPNSSRFQTRSDIKCETESGLRNRQQQVESVEPIITADNNLNIDLEGEQTDQLHESPQKFIAKPQILSVDTEDRERLKENVQNGKRQLLRRIEGQSSAKHGEHFNTVTIALKSKAVKNDLFSKTKGNQLVDARAKLVGRDLRKGKPIDKINASTHVQRKRIRMGPKSTAKPMFVRRLDKESHQITNRKPDLAFSDVEDDVILDNSDVDDLDNEKVLKSFSKKSKVQNKKSDTRGSRRLRKVSMNTATAHDSNVDSDNCSEEGADLKSKPPRKFEHNFSAESAVAELFSAVELLMGVLSDAISQPDNHDDVKDNNKYLDFVEIAIHNGHEYITQLHASSDAREPGRQNWLRHVIKGRAEFSPRQGNRLYRLRQWLKWWWTDIAAKHIESQLNGSWGKRTHISRAWQSAFDVSASIVHARLRQCDRVYELQYRCGWPALVLATLATPAVGPTQRMRKSHLERGCDATQISHKDWNEFIELAESKIFELREAITKSCGYDGIRRIIERAVGVKPYSLQQLSLFPPYTYVDDDDTIVLMPRPAMVMKSRLKKKRKRH